MLSPCCQIGVLVKHFLCQKTCAEARRANLRCCAVVRMTQRYVMSWTVMMTWSNDRNAIKVKLFFIQAEVVHLVDLTNFTIIFGSSRRYSLIADKSRQIKKLVFFKKTTIAANLIRFLSQ